ncbi:MAG: chromate efflux transporter, partial [Pseudomonadota bacterium]
MRKASPDDETLLGIFRRFLRFGFLAWGGPVAQIAMIKHELVDELRWIEPARFSRLLAIYQVLPGPEAHELCVHFGMLKRGRLGGLLAGLGFMLPGLVLILGISWLYGQLDLSRPPFAALFLGAQIGVVALVARAVHRISDHVLVDPWLWAIAAAGGLAALLGVSFWIILPAAGLTFALAGTHRYLAVGIVIAGAISLALLTTGAGVTEPMRGSLDGVIKTGTIGAIPLFLSGLKAGLLTFGGAYTAIPFVRGDAVGRGWISEHQFLDGLALSGIIPAPLIIFATFVGYQAGGLAGGLAMTAGIFLPAFGFAILFFDRLELVVEDQRLHRLLEGVAAAVVGLIAATTLELGANLARGVPSLMAAIAIFLTSLALLYAWRSKLNVLAVLPLS